MVKTKKCSACREIKDPACFGKNKAKVDGLNPLCRPCALARSRAWAAANPEKIAAQLARRNANPEKEKARHAKRNAEFPEKRKEACRKWRLKNLEKERKRCRDWFAQNGHMRNAYSSKFRADLLQRTPNWLTQDDFSRMQFIYELAKGMEIATGEAHHVDHILPLRGKFVSGLHVPENLQILTALSNQRKSNKWKPE